MPLSPIYRRANTLHTFFVASAINFAMLSSVMRSHPVRAITHTVATILVAWCISAPLTMAVDKAKVAELLKELADEDYPVRAKAAQELQDMGEPTAKYLLAMPDHPNPEVREQLNKILKDYIRDPRELKWIDPKLLTKEEYWSGKDKEGVRLTFANHLDETIKIYWVEYDGSLRPWNADLRPGRTAFCYRSYKGHTWLITDTKEKHLGLYTIDRDKPVLAIREIDIKKARK